MRLFLALEIPGDVRGRLWESAEPLRESFPRIRWVPETNVHLTLRFLGESREDQASAAFEALGRVAAESEPWQTRWEGIGGFPSLRSATTLWVGLTEEQRVKALAAQVEDALAGAFAPGRRSFHPHVTLGRASRPVRILDRPAAVQLETDPFELRDISLIRSDLHSDGPSYERLETRSLGVAGDSGRYR